MAREEYLPTIGLEVHAELKTQTKMFCNSRNDPDETRPNVNVCPVCMGQPGTLPVINKEAVKHVLKVGAAVGGELADFTEFERKNYFYPDIPKGYQISQFGHPLVRGGVLNGVKLTRIHLEEDTATSYHDRGDCSLIDFNRAGVPLMELVTEPVIRSAKEAVDFARELQLLLRYLGVSDADMEKGEMRIEANISVGRDGALGTKVEVKNLNSFKAVEGAVEYEVKRQWKVLLGGGRVVRETRGWNDSTGETFSQRHKEESHDYRYFPDPDLPKLHLSEVPEFEAVRLRRELPELPAEKRDRYAKIFGIKSADIEVFIRNRPLGMFFESVAGLLSGRFVKLASNYIVSDLIGLIKENRAANSGGEGGEVGGGLKILPEDFAELIKMVGGGELSSRGAKDLLKVMVTEGGYPRQLAKERGLLQKSDSSALVGVVKSVIADNPGVVGEVRNGKTAALEYLVGQGMKRTKGAANPSVLREILKKEIEFS